MKNLCCPDCRGDIELTDTAKFADTTNYNILFTENLFHPEFKIISKSLIMAYLDAWIGKTIFAKFLAR